MGRININVEQGASFFLRVTVEDQTGAPLDMTNYTLKGQMRKHHEAADYVNMTLTKGTGTIDITFTATQTAALVPGYYVYDINMKDLSDNVTRLFDGMVYVASGVTQWTDPDPAVPEEDTLESGDRIQ